MYIKFFYVYIKRERERDKFSNENFISKISIEKNTSVAWRYSGNGGGVGGVGVKADYLTLGT